MTRVTEKRSEERGKEQVPLWLSHRDNSEYSSIAFAWPLIRWRRHDLSLLAHQLQLIVLAFFKVPSLPHLPQSPLDFSVLYLAHRPGYLQRRAIHRTSSSRPSTQHTSSIMGKNDSFAPGECAFIPIPMAAQLCNSFTVSQPAYYVCLAVTVVPRGHCRTLHSTTSLSRRAT